MIRSFASKETERLFRLHHVKGWEQIERTALRKLVQLDLAKSLDDMRAPPGNRLEALKGNWQGYWSVRINDQFRLCFRWTADGAEEVQIIDYH
jgi:toxin HigB-1